MNLWQHLRQIRSLLRAAVWSGGSTVVFASNSVQITGNVDPAAISSKIVPAAFIRSGGSQSDPDHQDEPGLMSRTVTVRLYTAHADEIGQAAFAGGHRSGGLTSSKGRGLLELEMVLFDTIKKLVDGSGIHLAFIGEGADGAYQDENRQWVAWCDYNFRAVCTDAAFYYPCRKLAATGGVGQVSLTWALPPSRFDFYKPRLTRKTGSTAPTSPTDGTEISLAASDVSKVDSGLSAGTYSYSLWASYDDIAETPATNRNLSRLLSVTGVTVT